jgi:hypothetical protein
MGLALIQARASLIGLATTIARALLVGLATLIARVFWFIQNPTTRGHLGSRPRASSRLLLRSRQNISSCALARSRNFNSLQHSHEFRAPSLGLANILARVCTIGLAPFLTHTPPIGLALLCANSILFQTIFNIK